MIFLKSILATVFTLALASCATAPVSDIQVEAETDPGVNFADYSTYGWLASAEILYDPEGQWEPRNVDIDADVRHTINTLLRKRGMSEVNNNPDVMVAFAAGVDMTQLELRKNPEHDSDMLVNVPKAALVVALIDTRTGYVIWLGTAVGNVQESPSEDQVRYRIEYAIDKMFSLLPEK